MSRAGLAEEILRTLERRRLDEGEVFLKCGRSRRFELGPNGRLASASQEEGWAIRAGNRRSSLFVAGTGLPQLEDPWPEPDGMPLQLPVATPMAPWMEPPDLDASLTGESEAIALLESIERCLLEELHGSRLLRGLLEEGSSETEIISSRGIEVSFRSRAASLFLEAVGPWPGAATAQVLLSEREVRRFQPAGIAGQLVNRITLEHEGTAPERERGEILLGSAVAVRLLSGLLPLLVGPAASAIARQFRDRQGRIGSRALTIIDNGRLPGGVLEAPADGEGVPTREVILVEEGRYLQPLVGWRDSRGPKGAAVGNMRRHGWRDQPRLAPSHLFLSPRSEVSVASLLGSVARGYYLVEPTGVGSFDLQGDHFHIPVCGFVLRQGRAIGPLARAWFEGSIRSLLQGIQAVGRDLTFYPLGAMVGSPTLLITGVGLRRAPGSG